MDQILRTLRRLNLRDLRVFMAVAQAGSMVRAADQLGMSQPSVSKTIKDLEGELGVQLFERSTRGVMLNVYGEALVRSSSVIFDELEQGLRSLHAMVDPTQGELRIGVVAGITQMMFLNAGVQRFRKDAPNVMIQIDELPSIPALVAALRDRRYDMGLLRTAQADFAEGDLDAEALFQDQLVFVAGSNHRLAGRQSVELAELVEEQWIVGSTDNGYHTPLARVFAERGLILPRPSIVTLSVTFRAQMLETGHFIAPFSEAVLPLINAQRQPIRKLAVKPAWPARSVMLLTLRGRTLVPMAQSFFRRLRETASEFARDIEAEDDSGQRRVI